MRNEAALCRPMAPRAKWTFVHHLRELSDEWRGAWQDNPDLGKCTRLCIELDCARVLFHDDVVTDREAKARAFSRRFGCEERFNHLFFHVRQNACAVIPNPDLHLIAKVFGRGRQSWLVVAIIGLGLAFGRIEAVCNQSIVEVICRSSPAERGASTSRTATDLPTD
jgi:hypothetical protein